VSTLLMLHFVMLDAKCLYVDSTTKKLWRSTWG